VRRARGALVTSYIGDGGATVYAGTAKIDLPAGDGGDTTTPDSFERVRPVFEALRPYGADDAGQLARPLLPRRLLARLRQARHERARMHSITAVARKLRVSRDVVLARLKADRRLRSFGPVGSVDCPPPHAPPLF
jgi:hypothetical protein